MLNGKLCSTTYSTLIHAMIRFIGVVAEVVKILCDMISCAESDNSWLVKKWLLRQRSMEEELLPMPHMQGVELF